MTGGGTPPAAPTKRLVYGSMPMDEYAELERYARENERSVRWVVSRAVAEFMRRQRRLSRAADLRGSD